MKHTRNAFRVNFDRKFELEFQRIKVTSDVGLLAYGEPDEALGLTSVLESEFYDNRKGKNTRNNIIALLRQSIYSRLVGYEDTDDAEHLCIDPTMEQVVG